MPVHAAVRMLFPLPPQTAQNTSRPPLSAQNHSSCVLSGIGLGMIEEN